MRRALAAVALALTLALCGCVWRSEFPQTETGGQRFTVEETDKTGLYILVDRQTGVQYLYVQRSGLTPLLDADGTPELVGEVGE